LTPSRPPHEEGTFSPVGEAEVCVSVKTGPHTNLSISKLPETPHRAPEDPDLPLAVVREIGFSLDLDRAGRRTAWARVVEALSPRKGLCWLRQPQAGSADDSGYLLEGYARLTVKDGRQGEPDHLSGLGDREPEWVRQLDRPGRTVDESQSFCRADYVPANGFLTRFFAEAGAASVARSVRAMTSTARSAFAEARSKRAARLPLTRSLRTYGRGTGDFSLQS
jgi:hypothetical protein